eukprot:CAMPEP_0115851190 /NCGR_PEP_ID=MMETSP0287-20121206/12353_1 /TAXON_ID=412157 /ORGANISM="Chrysochromulina rotalis, Strain UIO044" /LENGTH=320 /DNA_ID=CAMNT_0003305213 /DNA_START=29 /DNA_END=991 /DNA_ORIENTATION=-
MSTVTVTQRQVIWLSDERDRASAEIKKRMEATEGPAILTTTAAPYKIVACTAAWRELCGFGEEALGASPTILQGNLTDMKKAAAFRRDLVGNGDAHAMLANYAKRTGEPFVHKLHATRVSNDFFLTESSKVTDVHIRRAVLKIDKAEEQTAQLVAIALAFVVTCSVILTQDTMSSLRSGIPQESSFLAFGTIPAMDQLKPILACLFVALIVTEYHTLDLNQSFGTLVDIGLATGLSLAVVGLDADSTEPIVGEFGAFSLLIMTLFRVCSESESQDKAIRSRKRALPMVGHVEVPLSDGDALWMILASMCLGLCLVSGSMQ